MCASTVTLKMAVKRKIGTIFMRLILICNVSFVASKIRGRYGASMHVSIVQL